MLLLDYALATPEINEGIAYYFVQAGCQVDYRQFYPNLIRDDLTQYSMIALFAGRTPAFPSGMMSVHEVAVAAEFVRNGGLLILGPNLDGGEGANERHLFNHLLADLDVSIRVCNDQVEDDVNGYAASLWNRPFYRPAAGHPINVNAAGRLAFERSTSLVAGPDVNVLLTSFETARPRGVVPVIALARAGNGFVLVAGRYLLNATGISLRISGEPLVHPEWLAETQVFLQNLAGYLISLVRGTTEWVMVNPLPPAAVGPVGLPDFDLDRAPVLDHLPDGIHVETFQLRSADHPPGLQNDNPKSKIQNPKFFAALNAHDPDRAAHYDLLPDERLYGWIRRDGVRASWGSTVDWGAVWKNRAEVERVTDALKACGVNLFWGIANCQAAGGTGFTEEEKAAVRQQWEWTAAALDGSSVKWYPTLDYRYFRDEQTRCYGAQGQKLDAASPIDLSIWRHCWYDPMRAIAEFSLTHPCIGGIAMDLELYGHPPAYNYYTGYGFEDECFFTVLERWEGWVDDGLLRSAAGLQLLQRFDWLRTHGLLESYFTVLSAEVERICRTIRDDVWRVNPDLLFASYIFTTPCNWFDLGVYRGFSAPERPLILMTFNIRSARMVEHLRARRVYCYHASVALLGMIRREEYETVFTNAMRYGHGYWMNNINAVVYPSPQSVESPARQGMSTEEAVAAIREANDKIGGHYAFMHQRGDNDALFAGRRPGRRREGRVRGG
ncbi:MAG: hypothetical protein HY710_11715 [Candidatus Latescibacteria bacterium]|nr:hypothetical protein [Candidatus Latescibacterota bacterium]